MGVLGARLAQPGKDGNKIISAPAVELFIITLLQYRAILANIKEFGYAKKTPFAGRMIAIPAHSQLRRSLTKDHPSTK